MLRGYLQALNALRIAVEAGRAQSCAGGCWQQEADAVVAVTFGLCHRTGHQAYSPVMHVPDLKVSRLDSCGHFTSVAHALQKTPRMGEHSDQILAQHLALWPAVAPSPNC